MAQANAYFGGSVGTAGDVNGDGYADVIVGSMTYADGQAGEGAAFVYTGASGGLSPSPESSVESNLANARFGISVGTAGDVNGDGVGDVIVGAYGYSGPQNGEGRAYVYHGAVTVAPAWVTRSITYTYDNLHRLTGATYSTGESYVYQYDRVGNRLALTSTTPLSGTVVTTYTYDAANRLTGRAVSDDRVYSYTWSDRGQLLAEVTQGYPVRTFTYDAAGQLVRATVFTLTTEFAYNGLGARVAVSVAGQMTVYALDYAAGNRILAETMPTSTVAYLYGDDCLGEERDGVWLHYLPDAEGYIRQGTDAGGAVVSAWLFDPDGTLLEGPEGPVSHLVCGGVYDGSTGLIYKDGGYFDPMLSIWLALAPLVVVQGWRRKRKGGHPWVILMGVGLLAVGSLAGCCGLLETVVLPSTPVCTTHPTNPPIGIVTQTPGPSPTRPPAVTAGPTPTPSPGPSPTPHPTSTPSTPCVRGGSYAACFNSQPCAADGTVEACTGYMEFWPEDVIDQGNLDQLMVTIGNRLRHASRPIERVDPRRLWFDTPFRNASDNPVNDYLLQYAGQTYRRSEVNYIGQGAWGRIAGESIQETLADSAWWKTQFWGESSLSQGVLFWVRYGYEHV